VDGGGLVEKKGRQKIKKVPENIPRRGFKMFFSTKKNRDFFHCGMREGPLHLESTLCGG
jgi:hypothetical protein